MIYISVPRINANEDQLVVVDVLVGPGATVAEGDLLAVVESTKAAQEIAAPVAGTVTEVKAAAGDYVNVGEALVGIDDGEEAAPESTSADAGRIKVTAKARKLARELGVDLSAVSVQGAYIRVAHVEAAARSPADDDETEAVPEWSPSRPPDGDGQAVIVGAGGHAAVIIDALAGSDYRVVGCTGQEPKGSEVLNGVSVLGGDGVLAELRIEGVANAFIGVGGAVDNKMRRKLFKQAMDLGFIVPPLVHPSAVVGAGTRLAAGVQVLAGATIGPRCTIGANTIVNQGSIVCHDSAVGAHVHVTPGAVLAGQVTVGDDTIVGMGATVLFGARIGSGCMIHNSASVTGDLSSGMTLSRDGKRRLTTD